MKNDFHLVFLAFVSFTFLNNLEAQILFPSKKIREVFYLLPSNCQHAIEEMKNTCKLSYQDDSLQINLNYSGSHLTSAGLNIFSEQDERPFPPAVYNFVERLFLVYILTEDMEGFFVYVNEDKIHLYINGSELLYNSFGDKSLVLSALINPSSQSSSFKSDNYQFVFSKSNYDLTLVFPANNLLIYSMDKKEGDLVLAQSLRNFEAAQALIPSFDTLKLTKGPNEIFCSNERILHKGVSDQYYLRKTEHGYAPIFDRFFYKESLQNEFLTGFTDNQKKLNINHQQYGFQDDNYTLTLNNFLQYFRQDNEMEFYFGIENDDEAMLVASLFIKHKYLNSVTILTVITNVSDVFNPQAKYNCKLYSNIPGNNIKDLFGTYHDNSDEFFKINSR